MSGMTHFTPIFRDKYTVQHLNKGLTPVFFTERLTSIIKLHTAIILNMPFSIYNKNHRINNMHVMFLLLYHTY